MLFGLRVGVICCACLLMCLCGVCAVYCEMLYGVCYDVLRLCVFMCVLPFVIDGVMLNGSFLGCVVVVLVCAGACVLF